MKSVESFIVKSICTTLVCSEIMLRIKIYLWKIELQLRKFLAKQKNLFGIIGTHNTATEYEI